MEIEKIKENIKKYRKFKGLTQAQLGEKVGVAPSTIAKYEKGNLEPNFEMLNKLAIALECKVSDLLEENILTLKPEITDFFSGPGKVKGRDNKHFKRELVKYLEENNVKNSKDLANNILKHIDLEIEINKE